MLCGDRLRKRHEKIWGGQVEVTARVCLRDERGLDWCGRVKLSTVAGRERYLGGESIQFGDVLGTGVRKKDASRGLQAWGHKQILLPGWKTLEVGKWAYGKKMEDEIWDVLCFGVLRDIPVGALF